MRRLSPPVCTRALPNTLAWGGVWQAPGSASAPPPNTKATLAAASASPRVGAETT